MAPLPPSNTARLKVFYTNAVATHDFICRLTDASEINSAEASIAAFLLELSPMYIFSEVIAVQFANDSSDIFLDVPTSTLIGVEWGTGPANAETNAQYLNFVGRSVAGRRARLFVFGYGGSKDNFRLTSAESTDVADSVQALNDAGSAFIAIDGQAVIWKPYANIKTNDHWVKEARNG